MAKLYEKRVWRNDQTKLSAKNMNHIEDGIEALANKIDIIEENVDGIGEEKQAKLVSGENIKTINGKNILGAGDLAIEGHEHSNLAILEQITAPFTNDLKQRYDDKSTVNVSLLGSAADIVQYITVDGREYKLAGGSSILDYSELTSASLDSLLAPGVYKIIAASKNPEGTAQSGILNVNQLSDGVVEQEWFSTTNTAIRIIDPREPGLAFYVNGSKVDQGDVNLAAGGVYELSGDLVGRVIVGNESDAPNNRTKIILAGINIQAPDGEFCLEYAPNEGKMVVEVADTTKNYLMAGAEGARGDDDFGALHSNNNMEINGVGYLTIVNRKGHGVRASELSINGDVHMHITSNHDAVHGGKLLKITGGYFEVADANDAFSASSGKSNDGALLILGGEYIIHSCREAAFEGKSANGKKRIVNSNITFNEGVSQFFVASNASSEAYEIKVSDLFNNIRNNTDKELPPLTNYKELFGAPVIWADGEPVDMSGDTITLAPVSDATYIMRGDFTGKRIVTSPSYGIKVNVTVRDFYYETAAGFDESEPFWTHNGDKRLKLSIDQNMLMLINKQEGDVIKSQKNLQIKGKGDLIVSAVNGDALVAPGYMVIGGDGMRCIANGVRGVVTNSLRLGEDPDDIAKFIEDANERGVSGTAAYIYGNEQDVVLTAPVAETTHQNEIIATQYMTGCAIIGNAYIDDSEGSPLECALNAESGQVLQKSGSPYDNTALVYVAYTAATKNTNVHSYIKPIMADAVIPEIIDETASWIVYSGDSYSKAQIDEKFVPRAAYENLLARVEELERKMPADTTEPELSENGNLTLHNTEVADGDLNLGNLASLTDAGSLIL